MMHKPLARCAAAALLAASNDMAQAAVTPVQSAYGNVFPLLSGQDQSVFRAAAPAPWYVTFDLLTQADVKVGALGLGAGSNGSFFDLSAIRIVRSDRTNVVFGSDQFVNPFTKPIDALATADRLAAGHYALEVSGSGDRIACTPYCGDAPDFDVRLQVTPSAAGATPVAPVSVGPVQADYGNVFPTLTQQSLSVFRGAGSTWYVSFNLLGQASVSVGALGLGAGSNGSFFDLTSVRLVDGGGQQVAFGSDTFATSPFPGPVEALVNVPSLAAGRYAIEVSGSGDRIACTPYCGDAPDFLVRLRVLPVPEPGTGVMLFAGIAALQWLLRRRMRQPLTDLAV